MRVTFIILFIFVFSGFSLAQIKINVAQKLDECFSSQAKKGEIDGSVLVAENGKTVYQKSFNYLDFDDKRLNIQEKGRSNIDGKFINCFPDLPNPEITPRQTIASAFQTNRDILLKEISKKISDNYISAEIAAEIDSLIISAVKSGKFDNLSDEDFAAVLTAYLRSVTKDKHFYVKYLGDYRPEKTKTNNKKQQALDNISNSLENFGFEEVRRLEGNVGYINFKGFAEPKSSKTALASAMSFVANTNSLIIDLRENRGGDNGMLLEFCSYFLNNKTNIYETYFRNKGKTIENWTKAKVKGQKYLNKDIYLLTSGETFSAAEGLAFILQNYKLAQVIGEQTGGAANPIDPFITGNKYLLLIPVGKVTAALTKTNWEQIGVIPDEKVKAENALTKAHITALKEVLRNKTRTELNETKISETIKKLERKL